MTDSASFPADFLDFELIIAECERAGARLKASNFTTDKGLKVQISRDRLPKELRGSHCQDLELFLVQQDAVHCLRQIGYLREQAFRRLGGGTKQELDLDYWDHSGFWQLLCIDLSEREICGAYRLLYSVELYPQEPLQESWQPDSPAPNKVPYTDEMGSVHNLFTFSPMMLQEILPLSLELGRSFVNEKAKRAHLALPLMFEALGQIICQNAQYVLGKMTFYPEALDAPALCLLNSFLEHYWGQTNNPLYWKGQAQIDLAQPRPGLDFHLAPVVQNSPYSPAQLDQLCTDLVHQLPDRFSRNALHQLLQFLDQFYQTQAGNTPSAEKQLGKRSKNMVLRTLVLFLKYVSLLRDEYPGNGMHVFGGAINPHFGNVIEFMSLVEVPKFRQSNLERWENKKSG